LNSISSSRIQGFGQDPPGTFREKHVVPDNAPPLSSAASQSIPSSSFPVQGINSPKQKPDSLPGAAHPLGAVGLKVSLIVGAKVGSIVGAPLGANVLLLEGATVGALVGRNVGASVGLSVGSVGASLSYSKLVVVVVLVEVVVLVVVVVEVVVVWHIGTLSITDARSDCAGTTIPHSCARLTLSSAVVPSRAEAKKEQLLSTMTTTTIAAARIGTAT
jgi:hypothetical protein